MPKNAVERLQKIDNDIKRVLSIYDIGNSSIPQNDTPNAKKQRETLLFSKINTAKCWETSLLFDKVKKEQSKLPPSLFEPMKQIGTFVPRFEQKVLPCESLIARKKNFYSKKSSSAPSSSSTLSTICESDYTWKPSLESINITSENSAILKTKTSDSLNFSDWIDANSFSGEFDVYLTPSKTILTANEILINNNYSDLEKDENGKENTMAQHKRVSHILVQVPGKSQSEKNETTNKGKNAEVPNEVVLDSKKTKTSRVNNQKIIPTEKNSGSSTKSTSPNKHTEHDSHSPAKISGRKASRDTQKAKESPETGSVISRTRKLEKSPSPECKIRARSKSKTKESTENIKKGLGNKTVEEEPEKNSVSDTHKTKNVSASEKERNTHNEKNRKGNELSGSETRANELSKFIEKSNEKLEKMKVSKGLALDIAKQLKDKYEEMQQSKEELMEKLQTVEKDNERLNNEVKSAQESKVKLNLKMEGLKHSSKMKLHEEEMKTQEVLEENAKLKLRIAELEMQQSEKFHDKQNQIEKQKERVSKKKNDIKTRENQAEDVKKLANEKTELVAKVEELEKRLKDRETKAETQEEKIRQLEEELQKQQKNLKKKTERLEETNRELKSIMKNSNELEEQVKTLRKNIENFDDMQKNLINRTTEYENQNKASLEEIQTLQNENKKLKVELENEKDSILIKTKIIEDHLKTIKQLREKAEENKTLSKRNESLERILSAERDEKLELQEAVERLKCRKEELKLKIKSLENNLLLAPQEVVKDLQKTQMVLHELENQVQIKQKEWELHLQTLIREKEQACSVAEFATKKLMQTTNEFQKQSEAHKRLHRVLAENLAEKERHLREAMEKLTKPGND